MEEAFIYLIRRQGVAEQDSKVQLHEADGM
jgi:hypothetical protein